MRKGVLLVHGEEWECKIILLNCSIALELLSVIISQYIIKDISLLASWELLYQSKRNCFHAVSHRSAGKEVMGCTRTSVRLQTWDGELDVNRGQSTVEILNLERVQKAQMSSSSLKLIVLLRNTNVKEWKIGSQEESGEGSWELSQAERWVMEGGRGSAGPGCVCRLFTGAQGADLFLSVKEKRCGWEGIWQCLGKWHNWNFSFSSAEEVEVADVEVTGLHLWNTVVQNEILQWLPTAEELL